MKILHYTIGFPPQRTGGLVGYAVDIMLEQVSLGHDVFALYPADQLFFGHEVAIVSGKSRVRINCFELINSLPMALFAGIAEPDDFMKSCNKIVYYKFLMRLSPDVIHIHSFMGLHKEFLEAAKDLKIQIVYTTHDYYGLAPVPTFYYNNVSFDSSLSNLSWNIMSANALTTAKLRIFQTKMYPLIRKVMKKLNRNPKHEPYKSIDTIKETVDYSRLRGYYTYMFSLVDYFHFNSKLSQSIYQYNLPFELEGEVISISNKNIKPQDINRQEKKIKTIAYIGPDEEYKGYFDFISLSKRLDLSRYKIVTYGHTPNQIAPVFVEQRGRYETGDLGEVFSEIDVLVVPSKCKETFGLVALEAISAGVVVFVSENVGFKDLLPKEYIFSSILEIADKMNLPVPLLAIKTIKEHAEEVIKVYRRK